MRSNFFLTLTPLLLLASPPAVFAGDAGLEFFEKKIRPTLASHCYECHSSSAKKQRGGLLLDSRDGIIKGGDNGPVLVPGNPDRSLLIKAVRYDGLEMPPKKKGKLPRSTIADLEAWVRMGAPIPRDQRGVAGADSWPEVLKERRQWWSLQPMHKPALPPVTDVSWSANPIDRFLLAALEKAGLRPSPDADSATLIRRLSLVLTGLPPTPDEVKAFLKDESPEALQHLVDRLLATPHFGERWARHWMDVVRFSETHGKEWNFETPHAWRYRDYLIRAFNDDVPYKQLIREHLAGDLLSTPRRHRGEGFNESVLGTAFFHFGEMDIEGGHEFPQLDFDVFDNQIDTLSKAFQATTVACARCHDHKLDAVSMKDYYALLGVLRSSRMVTHTIDPPERHAFGMSQLRGLKLKIREELGNIWLSEARQVDRYLLAAQARLDNRADAVELAQGLDAKRLEKWQRALKPEMPQVKDKPNKKKHNEAVQDPLPSLLAPWRASCSVGQADFADRWKKLTEKLAADDRAARESNDKNFVAYADFRQGDFEGWKATGHGFREGPARAGEFTLRPDGDDLVKMILPSGCYTHLLSEKLNGTLRSPLLPRKIKKISFEVMGEHSSVVRLVENNGQLNIALHRALTKDQWHWITFTLGEGYESVRPHAELLTMFDNPRFPDQLGKAEAGDNENNRVPWEKAAENPRSFFGIRRVVLHEGEELPRPEADFLRPLFAGPLPRTPAEVAQRYAAVVEKAVAAWASGEAGDEDALWLNAFVRHGLLGNHAGRTLRLHQLAVQYRAIEKELAVPRIVPGLEDFGPGFDQPVFQRGDCKRPDAPVARRYLEVLSKSGERFQSPGSGRLELAERIASAENPLTARVMVNRIWHHLFGTGLVRTVDDFGHLGEKPSHPELLDFLAARFVEDGWSMKRLLRTLVLTRAFRMASQPSASARAIDPLNRLLQHYPARRLEAEAIRDAILSASGRLDRTLYGLSIEPFRDKEESAQRCFLGPLDGRGRRGIYIKNTMMEGPKFLVAFNFPSGKVAQGRRDVTNVPAQALTLLNDPFVVQQAGVWAERLTARPDTSVAARIEHMFWVGLGRPPSPDEREYYRAAASSLARVHRVPPEKILLSRDVWQDLAHVLFNVKEFIYIP